MGNNISTRLDLLKLEKAIIKEMNSKNGGKIKCLVVPIEMNNLYIGKDDKALYLNLIHFPLKNSPNEYGHTHTVKQSFTKDEQAKMTQEEKDSKPFLGSSKDFGQTTSSTQTEAPKSNNTSATFDGNSDDDDDLPF